MDERDDERSGAKRDRLARFYRVIRVLEAHGDEGVRIDEIARRVGMSRRTVYRDLVALQSELGVPVWGERGVWGVERGGFLPPLRLTQSEAMAVVLSARLMARYADRYDPDLAAAFQKLEEGLPEALRRPVDRTLEVLARRPVDEDYSRRVHLLTRAWADRRVVRFSYAPAFAGGTEQPRREAREARVRPYLIEPSLVTHALYLIGFDETRDAIRTFKIERIRELMLTADPFEAPNEERLEETLGRAWDIIADQPETDVVLRFSAAVAARVGEARWHPSQRIEPDPDGAITWRARVAGTIEIRLWILSWGADVEVLEPAELRTDVIATLDRSLAGYRRPRS